MKILETQRLILRSFQMTDLDAMASIDADPKVCEFLPALGTRENTTAGIQRIMSHEQQKGYSLYAVELTATHEMIGWIGLMTPSFEGHFTPAIEIGWRLASRYWNQGYATEGAKAVLDYAFTAFGLEEIVSFTVENNLPSRRVMEKIGLHHDPKDDFNHPKLPKHRLERHVLYRLTRSEYFKETGNRTHDLASLKEALSWITTLLKQQQIPYQIAGGLAARAYGAKRPLFDIDIDIHECDFEKIQPLLVPYITFGPQRYRDETWDLFLMSLNYRGQAIDISGITEVKICDKQTAQWIPFPSDFSEISTLSVEGLLLPVISKCALIRYKRLCGREVDKLDLQVLEEIKD